VAAWWRAFFGYRLFRIVLALFGFILGALDRQFRVGRQRQHAADGVAAGIGGLIGAGLMIAAYFVGVALVGAALGAVVANIIYKMTNTPIPHVLGIVFASIVGARGLHLSPALFPDCRHRIRGRLDAHRRRHGGGGKPGGASRRWPPRAACWVPYPLDPAPGQRWVADCLGGFWVCWVPRCS
jgi:hypothetical protein